MFPPPILPNADIGYGQQQDRPQESQDHALLLVAKCDASVSPSLDTSLSSLAWCDLDTEEHCAIVLDHSAVWVCAMLLPVRFSSCIWAGCHGDCTAVSAHHIHGRRMSRLLSCDSSSLSLCSWCRPGFSTSKSRPCRNPASARTSRT